MTQQEIYDKLHKKLADKYKVSPSTIEFIRGSIIGYKMSKQELIAWCVRKKKVSTSPKWKERLHFLLNNKLKEVLVIPIK